MDKSYQQDTVSIGRNRTPQT